MFVTSIIHKAVIEVDETGTTAAAAAATAVRKTVRRLSKREKCVSMDRPFLFLIMSSSDLVCFAGICARP